MRLNTYTTYELYLAEQRELSRQKAAQIWAQPDVLDIVANKVVEKFGRGATGLCHGVRTGFEVSYLRHRIGGQVIGTDLFPTSRSPRVIAWDFHNVKPEWVGAMHFVYSNSLDHAFNPYLCVESWISCLLTGGMCFVEWTTGHSEGAKAPDVFVGSLGEYKDLFAKYGVKVIKVAPIGKHTTRKTQLVVATRTA